MIRIVLGISLLVFSLTPCRLLAQDNRHLGKSNRPVPVPAESYGIHFQPYGFKPVPGKKLRVLVLGTGASDQETYQAWKKNSYPETGEPYDLVIGAGVQGNNGNINILGEFGRIYGGDRLRYGSSGESPTGDALTKAILTKFGGALELESLDLHSNGAPVGIAALLQGAFLPPNRINFIGPDPGIRGDLISDRFLRGLIESKKTDGVSVFISERDPIPATAGFEEHLSNGAWGWAAEFRKRMIGRILGKGSPERSKTATDIKRIEFSLPLDFSVGPIAPHYLEHYNLRRAIATGNTGIILKVVRRMGGVISNDLLAMLPPKEKALLAEAIRKTLPPEIRNWQPPVAPGGIALNPDLQIVDDIGTPIGITHVGPDVVLFTDKGHYIVEGIEPSSFAAIFRTVLKGEIPYVTIGTEPSLKNGYAKVTLSPSLINTPEGNMLVQADVQFKGVSAEFPFGKDFRLNLPGDPFFGGFPRSGGDFTRFWITSSGIRLKADGEHLRVTANGMQINGETRLMGRVWEDPELAGRARQLTGNWDGLCTVLPEFHSIQKLALATGLVFWARDNSVKVSQELQSLPARNELTPSHVPLIASGNNLTIAGGILLAKREIPTTVARAELLENINIITNDLKNSPYSVVIKFMTGFMQFLIFVIPWIIIHGTVFWLLIRWGVDGSALTSWRQCLGLWMSFLGIHFIVTIAAAAIISPPFLSAFDKDFVAYLATFIAAPIIVILGVRKRFAVSQIKIWRRAGLCLIALAIPGANNQLSSSFSIFTALCAEPVPGRFSNFLGDVGFSPAMVLSRATFSQITEERTGVVPLPDSWSHATRPLVVRTDTIPPDFKVIQRTGPDSPMAPWETLTRVRWPAGMPIQKNTRHYTVDGKPPF